MIMFVIYILLAVGIIFQILGVLSLHRFPDVYTRLHGATKCTTFGSIFIYLAIIVYGAWFAFSGNPEYAVLSIHTIIIMALLLVTNPTGAHAIARAAYRSGIMPKGAVVDMLKTKNKVERK